MENRIRECILNTFVKIKREADENQICKRKGVGAAILEIDLNEDTILTLTAINGPSGSNNECSNIIGACGCSHAEPRVIMDYLKHLTLRAEAVNLMPKKKVKTILLSTYSACVNCANIIIDSGIIDAVAYEILASYWNEHPRNANKIIESSLPHWTKENISSLQAPFMLKAWLNKND